MKYALFKNIQTETDLTTSDDDTDDGDCNSSRGSSILSERTINKYSRFFRYWN